MNSETLKVGDKVVFGRSHGEQTLGTVLKVNAKSIQVRQDESRGTMRSYPIGSKWKVPPSLCRKVEGGQVTPVVEAPKPRRPEAEILRDILGVYADLSPENLTCDGELPRYMVVRRASALRAKLRALFTEIGREVSEAEAFRSAGHIYYGA